EECLAICCPLIDGLCEEFARQAKANVPPQPKAPRGLGVRIRPDEFSAEWLDSLDPGIRYVEVAGWGEGAIDPDEDRSSPNEVQTVVAASRRQVLIGPLWDASPAGLPDR